jgi:hypothetical protein
MAKLATSLVTGGLGGGGTSGSISEQGARVNEGRSLDERGAAKDGKASPEAQDGIGTHEAQAAEGHTGRVLDLVGTVLGARLARADAGGSAPASSDSAAAPPPGGPSGDGTDQSPPSSSSDATPSPSPTTPAEDR